MGTPEPSPGLGAVTPTTVIGLTTGIFGTAQIGALITAAESKQLLKFYETGLEGYTYLEEPSA